MPALTVASTQPSSFASVKQRRTQVSLGGNEDQVKQEAESDDDTRRVAEAIFTCPEEGCTNLPEIFLNVATPRLWQASTST